MKKIIGATLASILGMSSAHADSLGVTINATSFSGESHPNDANYIRKETKNNKVSFITPDPERATYMSFDPLGVAGATHLTVTASSGALNGGTLYFRFANHYSSEGQAASVQIPNTGGWNKFQEFTVILDPVVMNRFGNSSLFIVVENPGDDLNLRSYTFNKSDVGVNIEAESYDSERFGPDYTNDIVNMGTKVGFLKDSGNWMDYDGINFTGGAYSVTVRASSGNRKGGKLVIYEGPPGAEKVIARVDIAYTGGWTKFQEFPVNLTAPIAGGAKNLSFAFESNVPNDTTSPLFDLDWFRFNMNPSNNVGYWINAATFDGESQPNDENTIRDMGNKVGFLRNINSTEYIVFDGMDVAGANSVTIRYSSAGTGGQLFVRSAVHYTNDVAVLDLPSTGGWDKIQEVTVPLDLENLYNGRSLFFTIEDFAKPEGVPGPYKFDIHAFKFNP